MIIYKNPDDNCYQVKMEKRARCSSCNQWLERGQLAWSCLKSPVDGNYVEHGVCRYGCDDVNQWRAKWRAAMDQ
jgi:hypothetical protein